MTSRRWSRTWRGWTHPRTPLPLASGRPVVRQAAAQARLPRTSIPAAASRFLGWLMWQQLPTLVLSSLIAVVEWLPGSVGPYIVGKIVDDGIVPHDMATVARLSLIMFGLVIAGIIAGVLGHTIVVRTWLVAMYGTDEAGHPQGDPDGSCAAAAYADWRGAQRLGG